MANKGIPPNPLKDLKHSNDEKDVFSVRIPISLISAIKKMAKYKGWTNAELVQIVFEKYLAEDTSVKGKRRK